MEAHYHPNPVGSGDAMIFLFLVLMAFVYGALKGLRAFQDAKRIPERSSYAMKGNHLRN